MAEPKVKASVVKNLSASHSPRDCLPFKCFRRDELEEKGGLLRALSRVVLWIGRGSPFKVGPTSEMFIGRRSSILTTAAWSRSLTVGIGVARTNERIFRPRERGV